MDYRGAENVIHTEGDGGLFLANDGSYRVPEAGFDDDVRLTPLLVSGPTLVSYFTHNYTAPWDGDYIILPSVLVFATNAGTDVQAELFVDGINLAGVLVETSVASGRFVFTGPSTQTWLAGPHTVEIRLAQPGGPGSITGVFAQNRAELKRLAP